MAQSSFSELLRLSEEFCEECFVSGEDVEKLIKLLKKMVAEIKKYDPHKSIGELLFIFVEKGARTAFLRYASSKTQRGEKATDGITSENEFSGLLNELHENYPDEEDKDVVESIFAHLTSEINSLSEEINITVLQSFNSVDITYKDNEKSTSERLSQMNNSINDFSEKYERELKNFDKKIANHTKKFYNEVADTKKKMHESNITILGIFSAFVLAFNAALTFSASVLQNLDGTDLYRILMASLIIGFVIINVLCGLFCYLERIRMGSKNNGGFKSLISVIISDVIILLLMSGLIWAWWNGKIEERDKKYIQETNSTIVETTTDLYSDTNIESNVDVTNLEATTITN